MMSLAQKTLAMIVLLALNAVVLVVGVGFGGILGLVLAVTFLGLSVAAAWRVAKL